MPVVDGLTDKQEMFCVEYLVDLNATQAAIRCGYAVASANREGSRLLSNAGIQARIAQLREERAERTKIDADWLLKRLADEATADINDLYDDDGTLLPVADWPLIWRQGLVQGIDVEELFDGRGKDREHIGTLRKIRLSDRVKRLELIGRHIGVQAFRDQVGLGNPDGTAIDDLGARSVIEQRLSRLEARTRADDDV